MCVCISNVRIRCLRSETGIPAVFSLGAQVRILGPTFVLRVVFTTMATDQHLIATMSMMLFHQNSSCTGLHVIAVEYQNSLPAANGSWQSPFTIVMSSAAASIVTIRCSYFGGSPHSHFLFVIIDLDARGLAVSTKLTST